MASRSTVSANKWYGYPIHVFDLDHNDANGKLRQCRPHRFPYFLFLFPCRVRLGQEGILRRQRCNNNKFPSLIMGDSLSKSAPSPRKFLRTVKSTCSPYSICPTWIQILMRRWLSKRHLSRQAHRNWQEIECSASGCSIDLLDKFPHTPH